MSKEKYHAGPRPGTLKRKIPKQLVAVFGRKEVWKALQCLPGDDLKAKRSALNGNLDLLFARARQEATPGQLSPEFVRELECLLSTGKAHATAVDRLADYHVAPMMARYRRAVLVTEQEELRGMGEGDLRTRATELAHAELQLRAAATRGSVDLVDDAARMLLAAERLQAVRGTPEFSLLVHSLLATDLSVVLEQQARLRGDPITVPDAVLPTRDLAKLGDLVDHWALRQKPVANTVKSVRAIIREFEAKFGCRPAASITHELALEFRDHLVAKGRARKTIQKKVDLLGTLIKTNLRDRLHGLKQNPFRDVPVWDCGVEVVKDRRSFSAEELQQLFDSPVYREGKRLIGGDGEAIFWLPLISTFTGAREEEIAQLRVIDVARFNGIWAFKFVDEGELTLKTKGSYRWVPIHRELLRCGLLEYWRNVKEAGHKQLFPAMQKGANGKYSDNWSKSFNRYLDKRVGLDDPCVDFHSFRYTFKQQCTVCGIRTEVEDALTGHTWANGSEGAKYKRQKKVLYPFPPLIDAIATLRYDEVNLSHLYVCDDNGDPLPTQHKDSGGQS